MGLFDSWMNPWQTTTTDASGNLLGFSPGAPTLSALGKGLSTAGTAFSQPGAGGPQMPSAPPPQQPQAFSDPTMQLAMDAQTHRGSKTLALPKQRDNSEWLRLLGGLA